MLAKSETDAVRAIRIPSPRWRPSQLPRLLLICAFLASGFSLTPFFACADASCANYGQLLSRETLLPIPNATVRAELVGVDSRPRRYAITTDASGHFSFEVNTTDSQSAEKGVVIFEAEGFATRTLAWTPCWGHRTTHILLDRGVTIGGTVRTELGVATAGHVMVFDGSSKTEVPLDANGTFRTRVPMGRYQVVAVVPGYAPTWGPIRQSQAGRHHDLHVARGHPMGGRIVDANSQPLTEAELIVEHRCPFQPSRVIETVSRADAVGRIEFRALHNSVIRMESRVPGCLSSVTWAPTSRREHDQVSLPVHTDGCWTHKPAVSATLRIDYPDTSMSHRRISIRAEHTFSSVVHLQSESVRVNSLPAGTTQLIVTTSGARATVDIDPYHQNTHLELPLEPVWFQALGENGAPISSVRVQVHFEIGEPQEWGMTDADGRIELHRPIDGTKPLFVTFRHPRYLIQTVPMPNDDFSPRVTLKRVPPLHGVVTDRDGNPLLGARVHVEGPEPNLNSQYRASVPWSHATETSIDGSFRLAFGDCRPSVDPREEAHVVIHSPGYAPARIRWRRHSTNHVQHLGTIRLHPTPTIVGRVTTASGAPIEGALVTARSYPHERKQAFTEADGSYRLSGFTEGTHELYVESPRHPPVPHRYVRVSHAQCRDGVAETSTIREDWILTPGETFEGRITHNGKPAGDLLVRLQGRETRTDHRGYFRCVGLDSGTTRLYATLSGVRSYSVSFPRLADLPVAIEISSGSVEFTFSEPLADTARVRVLGIDQELLRDGQLFRLPALPPKDYRVWIAVDERAPVGPMVLHVVAGETRRCDVQLPRQRPRLRVEVRNHIGQPIAGATVETPNDIGVTNHLGVIEVPGPDLNTRSTITASGYAPRHLDLMKWVPCNPSRTTNNAVPPARVRVWLSPSGNLDLQVVDSSGPIDNATIQYRNLRDPSSSSFRAEILAAGEYIARVSLPTRSGASSYTCIESLARFAVAAGTSTRVSIELPPLQTVRAHLFLDGEPLRNRPAWLVTSDLVPSSNGVYVMTDSDGMFTLSCRLGDRSSVCHSILRGDLRRQEEGSYRADLTLPDKLPQHPGGLVTLEDLRPATSFQDWRIEFAGASSAFAYTHEDGSFCLPRLQPGHYGFLGSTFGLTHIALAQVMVVSPRQSEAAGPLRIPTQGVRPLRLYSDGYPILSSPQVRVDFVDAVGIRTRLRPRLSAQGWAIPWPESGGRGIVQVAGLIGCVEVAAGRQGEEIAVELLPGGYLHVDGDALFGTTSASSLRITPIDRNVDPVFLRTRIFPGNNVLPLPPGRYRCLLKRGPLLPSQEAPPSETESTENASTEYIFGEFTIVPGLDTRIEFSDTSEGSASARRASGS